MNKSLLTAAVTMALGLTACGGDTISNIRFKSYERTDSLRLDTTNINSPMYRINQSLLYPETTSIVSDSLRKVINQLAYGKVEMPADPDSAYRIFTDSITRDYRNLLNDYRNWPKNEILPASFFSWEFNFKCSYELLSNGDMSYTVKRYFFTGGAHGYTDKQGFVMNLSDGKRKTLTLLFKNSAQKQLTSHISRRVTDLLGIDGVFESFTESGTIVIEPTDNFYLTNEKIIFIYNPYEIAPYSAGVVEVDLSLTELKELMND